MSDPSDEAVAACDCVRCAISKLLNERYPEGFGPTETTECLTAISQIAGWLLAAVGQNSMQAFVTMLVHDTERERAGVHSASSLH